MSKSRAQLESDAERVRRQIADAEANLGALRSKLARIEAALTGESAPETGLDLLWKAALPIARTRSSKQQCRVEFNRIPAHQRPTVKLMVDALYVWNRSDEWKKDGNAYVPGLHRWIKARQWENLPEITSPITRLPRPAAPAPLPQQQPGDAATTEEILAILRPLRVNS